MRIEAHVHDPRPLAHTTEGQLKVLMGCQCGKTETIAANPRKRKVPWGFDPETWTRFLKAGEERLKVVG